VVDLDKLATYRETLDHLPADEQRACLARLRQGDSYEQIARDLGETSAAEARAVVSRTLDRLLRELYEGTAARSDRLGDLLGEEAASHAVRRAAGTPADMSADEEAILLELLMLAKAEPPLTTWGKFTDLRVIGSGGFGIVYSAMDPVLQTRVALKLYHPHRSRRPREELLSEARKLARVRHPNVVVVHGADKIDGGVGVWMELVEGQTLEEKIAGGPDLGGEEAAKIGIALCEALTAVHGAGIVHGDIKAQNVMAEPGGRVVLMDFGAARFRDQRADDANETRAGTPVYMAPELFKLRGDRFVEPTVQSDVYAVGVLLFALVSGRYPVAGQSAQEVRQTLDDGRVLLLRDTRPDLRYQFVEVVETALARAPEQRQLSAATLAAELRASRKKPTGPTPGQRAARFAGMAVTTTLAMGALGLVACRAFEVSVVVDRDLRAGILEYFAVGGHLLVPLGVYVAATALGLALLGVLRSFVVRVTHLSTATAEGVSDGHAEGTARLDPQSAAAAVVVAGAASWFWISWAHADIFAALVAMQQLPDPSVDLSVLSPALGNYQLSHTMYSVFLATLLGAAVWRWFPAWEQRVDNVAPVRLMKWATLAIIVVSLAVAVVPHRVLWELFEVVEYQSEEFYVVGASDADLQLFNPRATERARRRVSQGDPSLVRTGASRTLFDQGVEP
jgi:tRNA A-37 threonylcarbamoyl transferase component Bud32